MEQSESMKANLESYINSIVDEGTTQDSIESIIDLAVKIDSFEHNQGYSLNRINHNPREKAFHDEWLKENRPIAGVNYGQGILQDLFIEPSQNGISRGGRWLEQISNRDRRIVATVIQWLGSNVGFCFLQESLRNCGYSISEIKKTETAGL